MEVILDAAQKGGPIAAIILLGYAVRALVKVEVVPRFFYDREHDERMKAEERTETALALTRTANAALDKLTDALADVRGSRS